jgi:hypothetical protein
MIGSQAPGPQKTSNVGHYSLCNLYIILIQSLGSSVGEGTFGKVKLGKHILTGEKVILYSLNA